MEFSFEVKLLVLLIMFVFSHKKLLWYKLTLIFAWSSAFKIIPIRNYIGGGRGKTVIIIKMDLNSNPRRVCLQIPSR